MRDADQIERHWSAGVPSYVPLGAE